jgi:thiamine biosynthesis lipoprotein
MTSEITVIRELHEQRRVIRHREKVMGTIVTIDIYTADGGREPAVSLGLARARATLRRADAVFSTWKADSPMSRLRRGEITCDQAPREVVEVLELCAIARQMSAGWFDPWAMPGGVDPTGYVKGWAAQAALDALISSDISGAMVNAAGDIASFGSPEPATPFKVGIVDPFSPGQLACVIALKGAIATSGCYERGNHLIDPRSRRPTARAASASVCGPDLGLADALATALAVAGETGLPLINALKDYEAVVVSLDGTWRWTEGFPYSVPGPLPVRSDTGVGPSTRPDCEFARLEQLASRQ